MAATKWVRPPVHPAAAQFPKRSPEGVRSLADNIDKYGLQNPVVLFVDNSEIVNGATGPWPEFVLDGEERLNAMELLGKNPGNVKKGAIVGETRLVRVFAMKAGPQDPFNQTGEGWVTDVDPEKFVVSMNLERRHMTPEQRRQAVDDLIRIRPNASNRAIARETGVSHTTVADRRNGQSGQIDGQHTPGERVRAALLDNPALTGPEGHEQLGVAESTVRKIRKELVEEGLIPDLPRQRGGVAKPKADPKPKADKPPRMTKEEKDAIRKAAKITDDVSAVSVFTIDLVKSIKTVVKHSLNDEQIQALRDRRVEINEALRLIP